MLGGVAVGERTTVFAPVRTRRPVAQIHLSGDRGECDPNRGTCDSTLVLTATDAFGRVEWLNASDITTPWRGVVQVVSPDSSVDYRDFHQCLLTPNGRVACRGSNRAGQLGVSSQYLERSFAFRPVAGLERIARIGLDLALSEDGVLYAWANRHQPEPLEFSASVRTFTGRHIVLSNNQVVFHLRHQVDPPNAEPIRHITSASGCVVVGDYGAVFCRREMAGIRGGCVDEPVRLLDDNVHRVTQSGKLLREGVVIAEGVAFAGCHPCVLLMLKVECEGRLSALGGDRQRRLQVPSLWLVNEPSLRVRA